MIDPFTLAFVVLLVVLALLLGLVLGRRRADSGGVLQHQLAQVQGRLDGLASAQRDELGRLAVGLRDELATGHRAVGDRLADTGRVVADLRERLGLLTGATERLEAVGASVREVQELLRVPKLRGTVGELWLEELLRQVFPPSHYSMQHTFRSGERVDAVLRLGDRLVPVDAKFPLEACQRMLAAEGDQAERERRAFRRSLRARIDEIATKYLRPDEGTYDFALMYIPAEAVYYEAIVRGDDQAEDDSLMAYAMARKVVPVSPHTFYAYLTAVLHGLKGLAVAERAQDIQHQLGTLHQQYGRLQTALDKLGGHLTNAHKQYQESLREAGQIAEALERAADPLPEPSA